MNQQQNQPNQNKIDLGEVRLKTTEQPEDSDGSAKASGDRIAQNVSYLRNFLEPFKFFISKLMTRLSLVNNSLTADEISSRILEIVRHSSEADFVFVLSNHTQDNWSVKSQSDFSEDIDQNAYVETLKSNILPTISPQSVFNPAYHGIYKIYEQEKDISKAFVIVPLQPSSCAEVMVVCGLAADSYLLTDVYGRILSSFYLACKKLLLQPALIEAAIIDDLKRFGFISSSLYDRRFQLFCERLRGMVVYFEPILHLDPVDLYISGWEALARDPDTRKAPVDLFEAAELWGPQFTIELDQHFIKVATLCYREERRKAKQNRPHEIVPLSVNVYPESLMRTAYFETVRQIIENKVISPRNLILEISEKTELPPSNDGIDLEFPLKAFEKRLLKYVRELKIRFGIDDFGVGYASVSRLAGLNPPYVKIDREILYQEPTEVIIRFVHELVQADSLRSTTDVIVEGIDENAPISLHRLKQIGVSYIQGYLVGKPGPEIYRLSQEKAEFLRNKLLEPTT